MVRVVPLRIHGGSELAELLLRCAKKKGDEQL